MLTNRCIMETTHNSHKERDRAAHEFCGPHVSVDQTDKCLMGQNVMDVKADVGQEIVVKTDRVQEAPDGGYGWIICFVAFILNCIGMCHSYPTVNKVSI